MLILLYYISGGTASSLQSSGQLHSGKLSHNMFVHVWGPAVFLLIIAPPLSQVHLLCGQITSTFHTPLFFHLSFHPIISTVPIQQSDGVGRTCLSFSVQVNMCVLIHADSNTQTHPFTWLNASILWLLIDCDRGTDDPSLFRFPSCSNTMMLCCRVLHQHGYVFRMIFSNSLLLSLHLVFAHLQQEAVSPHVACFKRVLEMFLLMIVSAISIIAAKYNKSICRAHNRTLLCIWKAWPQSDMF